MPGPHLEHSRHARLQPRAQRPTSTVCPPSATSCRPVPARASAGRAETNVPIPGRVSTRPWATS